MRRKIVAGNWKMQGSKKSISSLLNNLIDGIENLSSPIKAELIVFPPFVYLEQVARELSNTSIAWGAQDLSSFEPGAHTGEIAATMLNDFQCRYVLVGHSERRSYNAEDSSTVARKLVQAKHHDLIPILCVGETQHQREAGLTHEVITEQIKAVLNCEEGIALFADAVIAYEPVWAIGTGLTAKPQEAQEVHQFIRHFIAKHDESIADFLPILYGGSVKPENAKQLFAMPDIDGGLIGGASLNAIDFLDIAKW